MREDIIKIPSCGDECMDEHEYINVGGTLIDFCIPYLEERNQMHVNIQK